MPGQEFTIGQYFRSLTVLHYALILGQILFALVAFGVRTTGAFASDERLQTIFLYLVPVLVFGGIIAGNVVYRKQVGVVKR